MMGDAAKDHALVIDRISKTYVRRSILRRRASLSHRALSDVSFSVRRGETVGLLGPNGAGKTTLLKIITTLLYPTSGRVLLDGSDVFVASRTKRSKMGLVTCDERSFYWRLTAWQNLRFFAALYGVPHKIAEDRIGALLETLGLDQAANRPYQEYSTGMRQKMAIARGLLGEPRLVLYDEPTRSLDPLSALNIRNYIKEHRSRMPDQTHLIATNQLQEAEFLCDRVVIIGKGSLIALGTVDEVKRMWDSGDYEAHLLKWKAPKAIPDLAAAPDCGLLAVEHQPAPEDGTILTQLQVRKDSEGLSYALRAILSGGGEILRCEPQVADFAEVFCALVQGAEKSRPDREEVPR